MKPETGVFKTVLLVALPASGKSEVRNFMANIEADRLKKEFHIGENLQLDDFPYVHFMRLIDEGLEKREQPRLFYKSNDDPFFNEYDWGTLILLLNEDYERMMNNQVIHPESYAKELFERLDRASVSVGLDSRISKLDEKLIDELASELEEEAKKMALEKEAQYSDNYDGKTLVIECARGGPDGSEMPLKGGYGYQYTLPMFSKEILDDAAILYIWVTPEESRRKNNERANPDDPGSNLFHGVPMNVMLGDYGCDDMEYLREQAEVPGTITVKKPSGTWNVPIGVFDNRVDKTSFLRADKSEWSDENIQDMTESIREATDTMWEHYKN